jgi:hypothetical protein
MFWSCWAQWPHVFPSEISQWVEIPTRDGLLAVGALVRLGKESGKAINLRLLFSNHCSKPTFVAALLMLIVACSAKSQVSPPLAVGAEPFADQGNLVYPRNLSDIRRPGQPYPSSMRFSAAQKGMAFVTVHDAKFPWTGPEVLWYPQNNKQNSPASCEQGDWDSVGSTAGVDLSNTLWIPQVSVYEKPVTYEYMIVGCGSPITDIPDPNGQPTAVAFDSNNGVYIENATGRSGGANIDVYPKRQPPISTVLQEPNAAVATGVALDKGNNVYMAWVDDNDAGHVDEFVGGQNPAVELALKIGYAGDLTFDRGGNLLLVDQSAGTVDVFSRPFRSSPEAKITLKGLSYQCSFGHSWKQLYCADYQQGSVDVYNYNKRNPKETTYDYSWANGLTQQEMVTGVSLRPAPRY